MTSRNVPSGQGAHNQVRDVSAAMAAGRMEEAGRRTIERRLMEAFMAVQIDANKQLIDRYRKALESEDLQQLSDLQTESLADDYVQEWPQSGERIRRDGAIEINKQYTQATGNTPKMKLRRITTKDDLAVVEGTIDYGDGTPVSYVAITELRDGKIVRNTEYFANPFEAPEWRKQYVERMG